MAKRNRVPFQAGMSLTGFLAQYGRERPCEAAVEKSRWPNGFVCPEGRGTGQGVVGHDQVKTFPCAACRQQTTLTGGTIFTRPSGR